MGNRNNRCNIDGKECAICLERISNDSSRPECCSNHFFHHDCLMKWSNEKNTCPLDNKEFTSIIDGKGRAHAVTIRRNISLEGGTLSIRDMRLHPISYWPAAELPHVSRLLIQYLIDIVIRCGICGEVRGDLERAQTDACGHNFHRQCLVESARSRNACPVQRCESEFSEIECEFGEVIPIADLQRSCECAICHERLNGEETATPNGCRHRFHRQCLHSAAKRNNRCPIMTCNSDILFLKCDEGERIVIKNSIRPFRCFICNETDPEKESARVSPCGHQFHRDCLFPHYRDSRHCPLCNRTITKMYCQFGDTLEKYRGNIREMMGRFRLRDDFQCAFCCTSNPEGPLSKIDCGCKFHSACIEEFTRQRSQRLCLNCEEPYTTITPILDNFCNLENRSPVSNEESSDEQASSNAMSNSETNVAATSMLDDRMYSEGAVGGVDVHICSLCDSEIPADDATRSGGSSHWYHRVCMQSLSGQGERDTAYDGDFSNVVDHLPRINIRDEFPRVSSSPTRPANDEESDPF